MNANDVIKMGRRRSRQGFDGGVKAISPFVF